ncbi:MAG: hypothetical protein J0H88_08355 [Sphingomonadales bacterium]|nr:hypothetical protein [Sphingomonadales bacterium]
MKKRAYALAIACALTLVGCTADAPPQPTGPVKEVPCGPGPQPNGDPCP